MARPRPEKKNQPPVPAEQRVLPMELRIGDRLTDETAEWEIIGRPCTTNMGKNAHVRVRRVDGAEVTMMRTWRARARRRPTILDASAGGVESWSPGPGVPFTFRRRVTLKIYCHFIAFR